MSSADPAASAEEQRQRDVVADKADKAQQAVGDVFEDWRLDEDSSPEARAERLHKAEGAVDAILGSLLDPTNGDEIQDAQAASGKVFDDLETAQASERQSGQAARVDAVDDAERAVSRVIDDVRRSAPDAADGSTADNPPWTAQDEERHDGDLGKALGVDNKWAFNVVKGVGNYGEMFDRNIGPLGIPRGINNLWNNGGLHYPPPIR